MRTIFVICAAGQEIRNFLYSDFYKLAKAREDLRFVVFVPSERIDKYREKFQHDRCIIEPIVGIDLSWRAKEIFRIACFGCVPTITIKSRNWFSYLNGGSLGNFLAKQLFWVLGHFRIWRAFMRALDDAVWAPYFEKYKPNVVFGAGLLNEEDFTAVKHAKRRGIPTVGMTRSWDNFTSKGFLRVHPDILIVQNKSMVAEAVRLNSFPRERIRVAGFPQWDHYRDSTWHMTKEEFAKKFGLDAAKRWIVWFGGGLMTGLFGLPDKGDHIVMLADAAKRGEIKNAQILARVHPGHEDSMRPEARAVAPVLNFGKGWDFTDEDIKFLLNLVRLSDVTLNLGSTMALEATIFDKPVVLIGFNGFDTDDKIPWSRRLSAALDNTLHYREVEATGGVWRVRDEKELVHAVKTYLETPSLHHEGREKIVEQLVGPVDGKASARIFETVISLLGQEK